MLKLCLSLSNNQSCHSGREIGRRDRERERGGEWKEKGVTDFGKDEEDSM